MVRIEIDGVQLEVAQGSMIIEAADKNNIEIPRFCYHKKLSIAANCRMCLVEVEKTIKPMPACATPVTQGMIIHTSSAAAKTAQRAIMEFLLINHPLDCPICDQAGECELQDNAMKYGKDISRFNEGKRSVANNNLGSLISTDMTRCIHCTRCVRFGVEIAGMPELGAVGRGENMQITTFVESAVDSEVSGNVIDLCPVGALTSKPFRFKARSFELESSSTVSAHDCFGSNLFLHSRRQEVLRVVPQENEAINETWLADRDRFSYLAARHEDRLRNPMLKKDGKWVDCSWVEALEHVINKLNITIANSGPQNIGVLTSPSCSNEELYLLTKLMRKLQVNNIDHRLRQLDFSQEQNAPQYPHLGLEINEIENLEGLLLIGSNISKEVPIAGLKLNKLTKNSGKIFTINPKQFAFNFPTNATLLTPGTYYEQLECIALALTNLGIVIPGFEANNVLQYTVEHELIAKTIQHSQKFAILLGYLAIMSPNYHKIMDLGQRIATATGASFGVLSIGANAAGAWLGGCVPMRTVGGTALATPGLNAKQMLESSLAAYVLVNIEPDFDSILSKAASKNIAKAGFVVSITSFKTDNLLDIADVLLPMAIFSENEGSYTNATGQLQQFTPAVTCFGESRPLWKILRVLGNLAKIDGFDYTNIKDIQTELLANWNMQERQAWNYTAKYTPKLSLTKDFLRVAPFSLYAMDIVTRKSQALQETKDAWLTPWVEISPVTAKKYKIDNQIETKVSTSFGNITLPLHISSEVADNIVIINQANTSTNFLGSVACDLELA